MSIFNRKNLAFVIIISTTIFVCTLYFLTHTQEKTTEVREPTLHAYYILDEKYKDDQDVRVSEVAAWKSKLLKDIQDPGKKLLHYNIFTHNGGGPLGAEWNSDGALYIVALVPYSVSDISNAVISLNGNIWTQDIKPGSIDPDLSWIAIEVPSDIWQRYLQETLMFDHAYPDSDGTSYAIHGLKILNVDLNVKLKIGKEIQQITLSRSFKIVSGE